MLAATTFVNRPGGGHSRWPVPARASAAPGPNRAQAPASAILVDSLAGQFGLKPFIIGTIWVTAIAVVIAVPLCLLTAVFLSEYAPCEASRRHQAAHRPACGNTISGLRRLGSSCRSAICRRQAWDRSPSSISSRFHICRRSIRPAIPFLQEASCLP